MSGDDWEIKWVLRTRVPSVEVGSNVVHFCRASVNLARNCADFHLVFEFIKVNSFMSCLLEAWNKASHHVITDCSPWTLGLVFPIRVIPGNSSWAYRLSIISLMYFIGMNLRDLPDSFFFFWEKGRGAAAAAKLLQLCPTLCDPIDGSPPGSPIPGIL